MSTPVPKANRFKTANYYYSLLTNPMSIEPSQEDIKCELQLQALSDFEPLRFNVDYYQFKDEIKEFDNQWVDYLPREGITNDRQGLLLVGLEGDSCTDSLSLPEARLRVNNPRLNETDFTQPTELYKKLTCLHEILDYWKPINRSMLVKTNAGGWFPPHKDHPLINRSTFRVVAFIGPFVDHEAYEWEMNGRRWPIQPNRAYYVDTRKTHRTHSWQNDSIHLIMNIPKTWENVIKLMSVTKAY